jgi:hypothetical protein
MGRGPPGPRSTMDWPPLPSEGAHWSLAYGPFEALGRRPRAREGGVAHGELDGLLTGHRAAVRRPGDRGRWWRLKACGGSMLRCER